MDVLLREKNINFIEITPELLGNKFIIYLDLRSREEFLNGHIPGAYSLPLLDEQERHDVGYTYKHEGKLPALSLGFFHP